MHVLWISSEIWNLFHFACHSQGDSCKGNFNIGQQEWLDHTYTCSNGTRNLFLSLSFNNAL